MTASTFRYIPANNAPDQTDCFGLSFDVRGEDFTGQFGGLALIGFKSRAMATTWGRKLQALYSRTDNGTLAWIDSWETAMTLLQNDLQKPLAANVSETADLMRQSISKKKEADHG